MAGFHSRLTRSARGSLRSGKTHARRGTLRSHVVRVNPRVAGRKRAVAGVTATKTTTRTHRPRTAGHGTSARHPKRRTAVRHHVAGHRKIGRHPSRAVRHAHPRSGHPAKHRTARRHTAAHHRKAAHHKSTRHHGHKLAHRSHRQRHLHAHHRKAAHHHKTAHHRRGRHGHTLRRRRH